jgi:signal transduction histidine kinase
MADSEQLKQVFVNLLDNAAEAMPGGGEITIWSVAETDANRSASVVVRIQDSGHGIPDDVRSRLFEPFFTTKEQGTGLGLCIAANIMAEHRGQLVLEPPTAGGSTFAVRLPIAAEKTDEQNSRR